MPRIPELSTASLEYVQVAISAEEAGTAVDPTADTVQMAFIAGATAPVTGDWKTASWTTDPTTYPPTYRAQCLVGPSGTVTLAAGTWTVWVKVTDSPEIPVKRAGQIKVV
jgi:hypothetical protein